MVLGAVFKAIGTPDVPLFEMPKAKQAMLQKDLQRFSDAIGAGLRWPSTFPINSVRALRVYLAIDSQFYPDISIDFATAVYRAYWCEGKDISSLEVLASLAAPFRFSAEQVEAAQTEQKEALFKATEKAVKAGVFGAPTFIADGELYWGQDRFGLVGRG